MRHVAVAAAFLLCGGCGSGDAGREHRADWVIRSKIVFLSEDPRTERMPAPLGTFRLWFPYVSGDLYGSPTTGAFVQPAVAADYGFELDLNEGHASLLKSLEPTEFSLSWLRIDPPEARLARLSTFVMEADGIEPLGAAEWLDMDSRRRLMLVYVDRPATISGSTQSAGHTLRYDVRAAQAGYIWIAQPERSAAGAPAADTTYTAVSPPQHVVLAVTPGRR